MTKVVTILLWCIRESRNETLGFSPFTMLMGRNAANLSKLLENTWSRENRLPETIGKSVSEFLAELQTQIQKKLMIRPCERRMNMLLLKTEINRSV